MFLIKFIEQWGTGTNRIIEECLNYGLPEPLFEEISGSLVVTFRKYHLTEEVLTELTERQRKIIDYLKEHKKMTRRNCIEALSLSRATVNRELSELRRKEIIKKIGKGKYTHYVLA